MEWLVDPFALGFQQRAFFGAALAAVATAVVGTWVIVRGMTFLGDALVHGVIPGIALAIVIDVPPIFGAAIAAGVMIAGINFVHRQTAFSEDTGIGLLFVGMLALGVILVSRTPSYTGSLTTLLFGDVLGVTVGDVVFVAGVAVVSIILSVVFYRHFLVLSFNEHKAKLFGLRPGLSHALLLGLMTLAIVGSSQTVGTLLVFGLLVGPPATAALLVRRVPTMMATAAAIGVVSVAVGLVISYHANVAGSATMAVVPIVLFFVVLAYRQLVPRSG